MPLPSDVSEEEWAVVAPYVALVRMDAGQRRQGSKRHAAVDTLGHQLALHLTAADGQDRTQVETLATAVQRRPATRWRWTSWTRAL